MAQYVVGGISRSIIATPASRLAVPSWSRLARSGPGLGFRLAAAYHPATVRASQAAGGVARRGATPSANRSSQ